jgi:hypothetical protein
LHVRHEDLDTPTFNTGSCSGRTSKMGESMI